MTEDSMHKQAQGHFTHETGSPWPLHFKHSRWWKGGAGLSSRHTPLEGPTEYVNARWMSSLRGFLHGIEWIVFHGHLDYFQKSPLGGRSNTKLRDHGTPNAHNRWFILFYHVWGPAWIEIHWKSIWLRAQSHMVSHYSWGSMTILHDFGGVLGWPLDIFFWALTVSWSWLLACVWSGPYVLHRHHSIHLVEGIMFPSPTGYMLWSFSFALLSLGIFHIFL